MACRRRRVDDQHQQAGAPVSCTATRPSEHGSLGRAVQLAVTTRVMPSFQSLEPLESFVSEQYPVSDHAIEFVEGVGEREPPVITPSGWSKTMFVTSGMGWLALAVASETRTTPRSGMVSYCWIC